MPLKSSRLDYSIAHLVVDWNAARACATSGRCGLSADQSEEDRDAMEREERERQRERGGQEERGGQGVIREGKEDRETQEERESQEDREGKEEGDTKSSIPEGMSKNQWKKMQRRKRYDEGRQEWRCDRFTIIVLPLLY